MTAEGNRVTIPVCQIEFDIGGHTIWIQSDKGATVFRIKCSGSIEVGEGCENIVSHADIMVKGDIHVCLVKEDEP